MDRRVRRGLVLALVCALFGAGAAPARAQVLTDLTDWNLTESVSAWGGGTQFHISQSGDGWAAFRWLDSPAKTTVISGNTCMDLYYLGGGSIAAGNTSYLNLFSGSPGACFVLRGRTAIGSGAMYNHDGRLKR
ncbi:hypothetical protein DVA67_011260 [Solirubrobacter sp. CPCC 204708]|uniref:Uncharacterized protein n=1 Tax=Solirubrobacter deserti TaxID=2282478 RepID=A0ABT4RHR7_9ACTN|nr:hypothetical protein [Solirubrobacter deserti]MBE2316557.1 hypothetical protein [Solirubrobacter deserti]MDA0138091.1 hypothetical protein [Solirubrobacter deserti]